jgi:predicted secreted protein
MISGGPRRTDWLSIFALVLAVWATALFVLITLALTMLVLKELF